MSDAEENATTAKTTNPAASGKKPGKDAGKRRPVESHAELLKQAVVSNDTEKFFTVVRNVTSDTPSKRLTIQDLDASLVLPTIKFITKIFRDDKLGERTSYLRDFRIAIDFLSCIFEIHSGYLSTLDNLDKHLGDLVEFASARTANIEKLTQLEGRLDFVREQMKFRVNPVKFADQEPVMKFKDNGRMMKKAARTVAAEDDQMDES